MVRFPIKLKINDSIEYITDYILEGSRFIQTLLKGDHITPPFQVCYALKFVQG